jgi:hypothetical protein
VRSILSAFALCFVVVAFHHHEQDKAPPTDCRTVTAADLGDPQAPKFQDYPAALGLKVSKPKLDLSSSPVARAYRTVLRKAISEGPDFADHYKVAGWGCGTACGVFVVVNLATGRVIIPESFGSVNDDWFDGTGFLPDSERQEGPVRYRRDSRLLVVLGTVDENESRQGAFYFVLKDEKLLLVHSTLVRKHCGDSKP